MKITNFRNYKVAYVLVNQTDKEPRTVYTAEVDCETIFLRFLKRKETRSVIRTNYTSWKFVDDATIYLNDTVNLLELKYLVDQNVATSS